MAFDDLDEFEADPEILDDEAAEGWDEETLGLDWNEAEAHTLVRDVVPMRSYAD